MTRPEQLYEPQDARDSVDRREGPLALVWILLLCTTRNLVLIISTVQSDPEGALWRDPPGYWEDIVYPAYVEAHQELFVDGDTEKGKLSGKKVENLVLLETLQMTMSEAVERSCEVVKEFLVKHQ